MPRKKKPEEQRRVKLNLMIHPEIRDWANTISERRRRSISQIFEELVEAEWHRPQITPQSPAQTPTASRPQQHHFYPLQPHHITQQQGQQQQ